MNRRRARELGKSLIVDLDGALAAVNRPMEERHSALASALITGARLLTGIAVNHARIADALDDLADHVTAEPAPAESARQP
jgi:hypothetical protein